MKKQMVALLAGAMLMMAAGSANALTLWVGDAANSYAGYYVFDNNVSNPDNVFLPGGAINLQDQSPIAGLISYSGSFNGFNFMGTIGSSNSKTNSNPSTMHLNTFELANNGTGTRTLEVWLTDTGFSLPLNTLLNPDAIVKSSIGITTPGTVSYQGYIDSSNTGANWGYNGGQLIDSGSFTAIGPGSTNFGSNVSTKSYLTGPFALTQGLSITEAANQTTSVDWAIDTTPVPEPGTMMLLGFGMLGLAVYGKRRMNKEA